VSVCVCVCIRGSVHEFVHEWGPASLARGRGHGQLAACLLVELLVKGTIFILAFYYIKYTLSDQIMHSEILIIWPLSVWCVCVCVCVYFPQRFSLSPT
jgi:hypothetical protein